MLIDIVLGGSFRTFSAHISPSFSFSPLISRCTKPHLPLQSPNYTEQAKA